MTAVMTTPTHMTKADANALAAMCRDAVFATGRLVVVHTVSSCGGAVGFDVSVGGRTVRTVADAMDAPVTGIPGPDTTCVDCGCHRCACGMFG